MDKQNKFCFVVVVFVADVVFHLINAPDLKTLMYVMLVYKICFYCY